MTHPNDSTTASAMTQRFRGFLPVVVDVETGGFDATGDALLEIAAIILEFGPDDRLVLGESVHCHVEPFAGANLDPKALAFTGIDPDHPFRDAQPESKALKALFTPIRAAIKRHQCTRAILVGHNAAFDLGFVNAAATRCDLKRNPFHPFSTFDTVSLAGLAYGETVLARAVIAAGMTWDAESAHSALYDAEMTARLFCDIVNRWETMTA